MTMNYITNQSGNSKPLDGVMPCVWDQEPAPAPTRFELWASNGFGPLLQPAGNPFWPIAHFSRIKKDALAKTPALLGDRGAVGLTEWNTQPAATEGDLRIWQEMGVGKGLPAEIRRGIPATVDIKRLLQIPAGADFQANLALPANISLRTGYVPDAPFYCGAIDIDVECSILALMIADLARECLGPAPRRTRAGTSRILLLYRLTAEAAALGKIQQKFTDKNGKAHLVEIILSGSGPQFIADGLHKSRTRYEWPDGRPIADELTEIDAEDIRRFLGELGQ
jgi:hypothetical protein